MKKDEFIKFRISKKQKDDLKKLSTKYNISISKMIIFGLDIVKDNLNVKNYDKN